MIWKCRITIFLFRPVRGLIESFRFEDENESEYEFSPREIWYKYLVLVVALTKMVTLDVNN